MPRPRRDLVGYGKDTPEFLWPDGKRLAVSIVVNYEEGSEHSQAVDRMVEGVGEFLPIDIRARDVGNESAYEYGPRVAVWRILETLARVPHEGDLLRDRRGAPPEHPGCEGDSRGRARDMRPRAALDGALQVHPRAGEESDQALRRAHRRGHREEARRLLR